MESNHLLSRVDSIPKYDDDHQNNLAESIIKDDCHQREERLKPMILCKAIETTKEDEDEYIMQSDHNKQVQTKQENESQVSGNTIRLNRIIRCPKDKGIGCGTCQGCQVPCCGRCKICRRRKGPSTPESACAFRICIHFCKAVRMHRLNFQKRVEREKEHLLTVTNTTMEQEEEELKLKGSEQTKEEEGTVSTTNTTYNKNHKISPDPSISDDNNDNPCHVAEQQQTTKPKMIITTTTTTTTTDVSSSQPIKDSNKKKKKNETKTSGWWDGNGICRKRAAKFAQLELRSCQKCPRCLTPPCNNICGLCRYQPQLCCCVLQCCDTNDPDVKKQFVTELNEMQKREERCLETGSPVWCLWKETQQYYKGTITKKWSQVNGTAKTFQTYFNVDFDDGDVRYRAPWQEVMNDFEMTILSEEERLLAILGIDVSSKKSAKADSKNKETKKNKDDTDDSLKRKIPSSDPPKGDSKRARQLSQKKVVGARVLVHWNGKQSYWGVITKIVGSPPNARYSILFEDGEVLENVLRQEMITEEKYVALNDGRLPPIPMPHASHKKRSNKLGLSLRELFIRRCGNCLRCKQNDCGTCSSCISNSLTTSRHRDVCIFKMCMNIDDDLKIQPIPDIPGWSFFFTDPMDETVPLSPFVRYCNKLRGLCVFDALGRDFGCLKVALEASSLSKEAVEHDVRQFYEDFLGIRLRKEQKRHPLLTRRYLRKWIDVSGNCQIVYGTIKMCFRSLLDDKAFFLVKYDEEFQLPNHINGDEITEEDAWGGCLTFAGHLCGPLKDQDWMKSSRFHINWIVPDRRVDYTEAPLPRADALAVGHRFLFEVRNSAITGAGLGLWVTVKSLLEDPGQHKFVLEAGNLIDLGVYGPLRNEDCKPHHIEKVKNYLHEWICESYLFDSGTALDSLAFDITDDATGKPHAKAKRSMLTYVNETNGVVTPSILAERDPSGSIHYFLGHGGKDQGPLELMLGESVELLIDYGPLYERVRVRNNYSRLSGNALEEEQKILANYDFDAVEDFRYLSVDHCHGIICFVEKILKRFGGSGSRLLIVAVSLLARLKAVEKEFKGFDFNCDEKIFCDNGLVSMTRNNLIGRTKSLLRKVLHKWTIDHDFLEAVTSFPSLQLSIAELFLMRPEEVASLRSHQMEQRFRSAFL